MWFSNQAAAKAPTPPFNLSKYTCNNRKTANLFETTAPQNKSKGMSLAVCKLEKNRCQERASTLTKEGTTVFFSSASSSPSLLSVVSIQFGCAIARGGGGCCPRNSPSSTCESSHKNCRVLYRMDAGRGVKTCAKVNSSVTKYCVSNVSPCC